MKKAIFLIYQTKIFLKKLINRYGFLKECKRRFFEDPNDKDSFFMKFNNLFEALPFAAVIENKFFCCHGGIGPNLMENYE
jgi:hypothetical protein